MLFFFPFVKASSNYKTIQCPSYLMFLSFLQVFPIKMKSNFLYFGANTSSFSRVTLVGIQGPNTLTQWDILL